MNFTDTYRQSVQAAIASLDLDRVRQAIDWFREAREQDRQIFVFGNGGSASTASHFAQDLLKGASYGRPSRFRILALNDSVPTITAYSNDVAYDAAVVEQLRNFARPGDLVMALSGSGNSPNVVRAVEFANSIGCRTLALTGRDGGKIGPMADLEIRVSDQHMGRIEDGHMIVCHMICYCFIDQEVPKSQ